MDGGWQVYQDFTEALPKEGRVFAPRLSGFNSRSLLAFSAEPISKNDQERDHYILARPWGIQEVLDFRSVEIEAARRQLVELGLQQLLFGTDVVVAALNDGTCTVVKMVRHPTDSRWVADIDGLDHLEVRSFDKRLFAGSKIENRWVIVPGVTVGPTVGIVNWSRDSDFLDSVLKRIRKILPDGATGIQRAQIAPLVTRLAQAQLLPSGGAEMAPMIARLRSFAPVLLRNVQAVDEIASFLGSLAPVQERLEVEFASRRAELEAEVRRDVEERSTREIEAVLSERLRERDRLAEEVEKLQKTAVDVRTEVKAERQAISDLRSGLADDLTCLLGELNVASPAADDAIAELTSRLRTRFGELGANFELAASRGPPWTAPRFPSHEATPWRDLGRTLEAMALRWGFRSEELQFADASVRAGKLVLLPAGEASKFVSCYAEALTGGSYVRHALDPSLICLDDLWRQPTSGKHTAFARAWAAALVDRRRFQIVLLDGLHRTPLDLWMSAFIEVIEDVRRPANLLIFAGLGDNMIDPEQAWRGPADAVVPLYPVADNQLTTPRLLARATGTSQAVTLFDAATAPLPTRQDVLKIVTDLEAGVSGSNLAFAADIFRSAWPSDPDRAAQLALGVGRIGESTPQAFAAGVAWLNKRLKDES